MVGESVIERPVREFVPRSADDEAVRVALSAHTWSWRFV
jgi:hypothetical protein